LESNFLNEPKKSKDLLERKPLCDRTNRLHQLSPNTKSIKNLSISQTPTKISKTQDVKKVF